MAPQLLSGGPLLADTDDAPAGRTLIPPPPQGWPGFALMEWELRGETWSDVHPFDEVNYVLDGELHVSSGGSTVVAAPGDAVRVPAGEPGVYSAPSYARMLAIYGPNPDGAPSRVVGFTRVSGTP